MDPVTRALRHQIARLEAEVARMQELLGMAKRQLKEREALQAVSKRGTVSSEMESAHKLAISAGRSAAGDGDEKGLPALARKAGLTLRGLAQEVGVTSSMLTMARTPRGQKHSRKIPRLKAKAIEKRTGYAATEANWPGGIDD